MPYPVPCRSPNAAQLRPYCNLDALCMESRQHALGVPVSVLSSPAARSSPSLVALSHTLTADLDLTGSRRSEILLRRSDVASRPCTPCAADQREPVAAFRLGGARSRSPSCHSHKITACLIQLLSFDLFYYPITISLALGLNTHCPAHIPEAMVRQLLAGLLPR